MEQINIEKTKKIFGEQAEEYKKCLGFKNYEEELVDKYFINKKNVLVLGCGAGRILLPLHKKGFSVTGIDISEKMIEAARDKVSSLPIITKEMNAADLKFEDKAFDAVIFPFNGICSLKNAYNAIEEAHRVLKKDGVFIFSAHNQFYVHRIKQMFRKFVNFNVPTNRMSYLDYFKLKNFFNTVIIVPCYFYEKEKNKKSKKDHYLKEFMKKMLPIGCKNIYFICKNPKNYTKFVDPAFIDRTKLFKRTKALLKRPNPLKFVQYRYEWNNAPKQEEVREFPVHLGIEPTNACNINCVFCARHEAKYSAFGFFDFELYKRIIDEGVKYKLRSVKLARGGESLMHPRFVDMIAYAKEKGIVDVLFNTNATLLTEEKAIEIIKAKPDSAIFSVDAPDKQIYESQRIGANYEEVEKNVKNFVALKNKIYPNIITRAHMVYTRETEHLVPVHLERWKGITEEVSVIPALTHSETPINLRYKCRTPFRRMDIAWNGDVFVCDPDYDVKGKLFLGNAKEQTIRELWHSEKINNLREIFRKESPHLIDPCKYCRGA